VRWEVWTDAVTYVGSALLFEVASLKSLSDIEYSGTTFPSIILMAEVVLANCEYRLCGVLALTTDMQKP
jgi:hypothetical protein